MIMVTGDAALTALHVAHKVRMTGKDKKNALILDVSKSKPAWRSAHSSSKQISYPFESSTVSNLVSKHDLIVSGEAFRTMLVEHPPFADALHAICIYARMTPTDKERLICALKERNHAVLMCGDGSNDVGALRQAHVGVALLSGFGSVNTAGDNDKMAHEETPEEQEKRYATAAQRQKERRDAMSKDMADDKKELAELQKKFFQEELNRLNAEGASWASLKAVKAATQRLMKEKEQRMTAIRKKYGCSSNSPIAAQAAWMASDLDASQFSDVPVVKLGDASVAAPFTSKLPSICSIIDIVQQGCCTLVGTIQNQQILALNCLIAAYSLAALYVDGIRFGEAQMIATGLLLSVASISFSYTRPVNKLSSVRPISTIFHPSVAISTLGQAAIHLACMVYAVKITRAAATGDETVPDTFEFSDLMKEAWEQAGGFDMGSKPFQPSLLNTVVFLVETAQQVSVMAVNYKGRPFMLAATENTAMLWSLAICCAVTFMCAFEVLPQVNGLLKLVTLPSDEFRFNLLCILGVSVFGSFVWDRLTTALFSPKLLFVGYIDAWNALPGRKDLLLGFAKLAYWIIVLQFSVMSGGIITLIFGWMLYRKLFPAPPPKPSPFLTQQPPCAIM